MKSKTPPGGCLPEQNQLLFMKACLLEPLAARQAWNLWREQHTLDAIDGDLYQLLPLAWRNLQAMGYDGPEMPILKGMYRRNWYYNQSLFHAVEQALTLLQQAGIPTLLLKGAALSHLCYPDPYTRCMADADLMVPVAQARHAIETLQSHGWRSKWPLPVHIQLQYHACTLVNDRQQEIDIHWRLLHDCPSSDADTMAWQRAVPLHFRSVETLTLSASDHLLQLCIHGYQWNELHPLRWIVDIHRLAAQAKTFEWDHIVRQARSLNVCLRMRKALEFLSQQRLLDVPQEVLDELQGAALLSFEASEHDTITKLAYPGVTPRHALLWPLKRAWYKHRRSNLQRSLPACCLHFPGALCRELHIGSLWQLPGALLGRAAGKIGHRLADSRLVRARNQPMGARHD